MKRFYFLSIITIITLISACKKDTSIGADILPSADLLNVRVSDTFSLTSKTLDDTFLRTDKLSKNYLGIINDPLFGFQKASIVMELDRPSTVFDDTLGPFTLDSVVLFLKYSTLYGDTTVPQSFKVSTIGNPINESTAYYSNNSSFPGTGQIGSVNNYYFQTTNLVKLHPADSVGTASIFRIKLNSFFGYSILNLGQNVLRDSALFKSVFPGIAIENSSGTGNAMAEISLGSTNSYIAIFYKDKYGASKEMKMYSNIFRFNNGVISTSQNGVNLFSKTHSASVLNTINSGLTTDSVNYILGQGGTLVKIGMPTITSLGKVAINKATLSITQIIQNSPVLQTPLFLLLLKRNSSGNPDILSTGDGVGLLDTTGKDPLGNKIAVYNFNISKYIQDISKGLQTNADLYIATYRSAGTDGTFNALNSLTNGSVINFSYAPPRVIVAGPNYSDPRYRMKLNLIYTLIK